jgi:hypothetical protein
VLCVACEIGDDVEGRPLAAPRGVPDASKALLQVLNTGWKPMLHLDILN